MKSSVLKIANESSPPVVIIHKFLLAGRGLSTIYWPKDSEVLSCGVQDGRLVIWAVVNPLRHKVMQDFYVYFTGDEFTNRSGLIFVGTQTLDNLVYHIFRDQMPRS